MKAFLDTPQDFAITVLRLGVGGIVFVHGLQKLGLYADGSVNGTIQFLTGLGIPVPIAYLVILGESLGALALILGFFSRFCAFCIAVIMAGAIAIVHLPHGFFTTNNGFEFPLLMLIAALTLTLKGGGAFSLDRALTKD